MTKNNHIYFILQFDPLKHSNHNSSCNLTYTPGFKFWTAKLQTFPLSRIHICIKYILKCYNMKISTSFIIIAFRS